MSRAPSTQEDNLNAFVQQTPKNISSKPNWEAAVFLTRESLALERGDQTDARFYRAEAWNNTSDPLREDFPRSVNQLRTALLAVAHSPSDQNIRAARTAEMAFVAS